MPLKTERRRNLIKLWLAINRNHKIQWRRDFKMITDGIEAALAGESVSDEPLTLINYWITALPEWRPVDPQAVNELAALDWSRCTANVVTLQPDTTLELSQQLDD